MFAALTRGLMAAAVLMAAASDGRAQSVADFYKGKTVDLYIGYSVGGGYDLYARLLARHMGKHIPGNPTRAAEEHGRRRQPAAGQLALQRRRRRTARRSAPSAAAPASIRCSATRRRSSTPPSSPGSAAPTTKSASASPGTPAASSKFEDLHDQGADRRRHRHLGRHRPVPAHHSTACSAPR